MLRWTVHLKGISPQLQGATAVAVGQKIYSFLGSYDSNDMEHGFQVEVHVFNTVTLRWTKLPPATAGLGGGGERPLDVPSSMCRGHSSAVAIEDIIYVWGRSWRTDYYDALYAYAVAAHRWHKPKVSGTVPEARDRHSSCVLGKVLYIYGGYTRWSGRNDSIYKLDTDTLVWSLVVARGTPPPVSEVQSSTVIGTKMFVFGGREGGGQGGRGGAYYNNIRVFDTETECWLSNARPRGDAHSAPPEEAVVPSEAQRLRLQLLPGEREGHSAFAYNGELYIFGGEGTKKNSESASPSFLFNDLWKFNPETFSWNKAEPKGNGPRRQVYGMCCCVVGGDRVVLFGGGASPDDLYILDLSPSLKTLSKLALLRYGQGQQGVPHCIRWELTAMLTHGKRRTNTVY